ncbi:MAG: mechanosensitive ion channel family protein, partial [Cyanobacteria bacterium J06598_3]
VALDEPSNLPVISVGEQLLMTVTNADAQLGGHAAVGDRAYALAETLKLAFTRYQQERQPAFLQRQLKVSTGILGLAALFTWWARRWGKRLRHRQKRLTKANTQLGKPRGNHPLVEVPFGSSFNPVFEVLKARLDIRQKRKLTEALQGGLILFQIGLWLGALLWILALFPYSRWLTALLLQWLNIPAEILLLCGLAYLAMRLASLVIDKAGLALQEGAQWAPEQSQRLSLRFSTLSQVAKGLVGSLILGLTILFSLSIAGVQVGPLLAGAGIIGVGISLAAQSLIKDFINGFLILFEDHFGMGDVIDVDGVAGTVEFINLRITQLRNTEGRLITIPNGQISIVQNLSMDWAQVDFSIVVAATEDVREALELLKKIATELSQEAQWQQFILEPPDLLGVEDLNHTGTTLRLFLKTQPLKQWVVARELRERIKYAFDAANIALGLPHDQVAVRLESAELAEGTAGRHLSGRHLPGRHLSGNEGSGNEGSGDEGSR